MFLELAILSEVRVQPKLRGFRSFLFLILLALSGKSVSAQDWFRTATGMAANKPRVAIADFTPRADSAKSPSILFVQNVRDDRQSSGILEVPSPSFYPPRAPSGPRELKPAIWIDPPATANFLG